MKVPFFPEEPNAIAAPASLQSPQEGIPKKKPIEAFYFLEKEAGQKEWKLAPMEEGEVPQEKDPWVVRYADGSWAYDPKDLELFRSALMTLEDSALSLDVTSYTLPEGAFHPWQEEEKKEILKEATHSSPGRVDKKLSSRREKRRAPERNPQKEKESEEETKKAESEPVVKEWLLTAFQNRDTDQRQMFEKAEEKVLDWQERLREELYGATLEEKAEKSMTAQALGEQSKPLSQQDYAGAPAPDLTAQNFRHLHTAG